MFLILIISAIIIIDRISKYLAVIYLKDLGTIEIMKGVFSLTYVENRGAAFGMLQDQRWFFIVLTIIISLAIVYFLITQPDTNFLLKISLAMILGGAVGNLIDRIKLGYVVDMLHFTLIDFPVFNVADSFLVMGTILLAFYILFIADKAQKEVA